ncbi:hypothetical protein BJ138DRAFT_1129855 [Hygrophoropsis aurantiaca]|uniref:Uncharacterized protein n=1 Tax=Hygrophoropsis aurantiaca TaxID=72124 RepID=A0ACB8A1K9_9AGAM|nr:hypothetical protein BJ138DRAFT_1129855 [Hygrophoropsis aurantiaca]
MAAELQELIPFLRDKNPQVRQIALSNLLGHTPKGAPHRDALFFAGLQSGGLQKARETDIIRDLKLLCRDQLAVAHDAFRALVNLSDSLLLVPSLTEPSFLVFLVSYILNPTAILADLASMLLSNLSASSSTCAALLSLHASIIPFPSSPSPPSPSYYTPQSRAGTATAPVPYPAGAGDARDVFALPLLVEAFAATGGDVGDKSKVRKGELHFLASVFANISTSPNGRLFFLTPRPASEILGPTSTSTDAPAYEYPLMKLVVFTEHKDTIRRGGVASVIKNCAFYSPAHRAILSPDTELVAVPSPDKESAPIAAPGIDALPYILLPLAGPDLEEVDLETLETLPTSLQLLPATKTREPDRVLRLTHVETLLLLCTTRWGREQLRSRGVYVVVRGAHKAEAEAVHADEVRKVGADEVKKAGEGSEKVAEHMVRLVRMLQGEEGPETRDDVGGEVGHIEAHAAAAEGAGVDEDEDSRIEEV